MSRKTVRKSFDDIYTDSFALGSNFLEFFQSEKVGLREAMVG